MYHAIEGSVVSVCAVHQEQTETDFTVDILVLPMNAGQRRQQLQSML